MSAHLRKHLPTLALLVALVVARIFVASIIPVTAVNSPEDDLLYAARAHSLVHGQGLGAYDAHTQLKLPGFSYFLAAAHVLHIPYRFALEGLFVGALCFLFFSLRAAGQPFWICASALTALGLHPWSLSLEWHFLMREPSAAALGLVWLVAIINVLTQPLPRKPLLAISTLLGSAALAALTLWREEEAFALVCHAALALAVFFCGHLSRAKLLAVFLLAALGTNLAARLAQRQWYGSPVLHTLQEGPYAELIQSLRRVHPTTGNLHQVLTPEAVQQIRRANPELGELLQLAADRAVPNDEGTLLFRLLQLSFEKFRFPDATAAERQFTAWRLSLDTACEASTLACTRPSSFVADVLAPVSPLRVVQEGFNKLGIALSHRFHTAEQPLEFGPLAPQAAEHYATALGENQVPQPHTLVTKTPDRHARALGWAQRALENSLVSLLLVAFLLLVLRSALFGHMASRDKIAGESLLFPWLAVFGGYTLLKACALGWVSQSLTVAGRVGFAFSLSALLLAILILADTIQKLFTLFCSHSQFSRLRRFFPALLLLGLVATTPAAATPWEFEYPNPFAAFYARYPGLEAELAQLLEEPATLFYTLANSPWRPVNLGKISANTPSSVELLRDGVFPRTKIYFRYTHKHGAWRHYQAQLSFPHQPLPTLEFKLSLHLQTERVSLQITPSTRLGSAGLPPLLREKIEMALQRAIYQAPLEQLVLYLKRLPENRFVAVKAHYLQRQAALPKPSPTDDTLPWAGLYLLAVVWTYLGLLTFARPAIRKRWPKAAEILTVV